MAKTVFVSYSHKQGDWVWDRLVPCLRAGGADVLIDRERFEAARALNRQMDDVQDRAELNVLVLSPDYLASDPCQHEMKRAIARDPKFDAGVAVPVLRVDCTLPASIKRPNPLYVDLRGDRDGAAWSLLLRKCEADLGATAPDWLDARDDVRRHLLRNESVNLVVPRGVRWRPLIEDLRRWDGLADLGIVDLESPRTYDRPGLVREILGGFGVPAVVPPVPEDLALLQSVLERRRVSRVALTRFDWVQRRMMYYGLDLFAALRYLTMEARTLVLLVQSHAPFATLVDQADPGSAIDLKTVELKARP